MTLKPSDIVTDESMWEEYERVRRAIHPFDEYNETEEGRREVVPFELDRALRMYEELYGHVELLQFVDEWFAVERWLKV